MFWELFGALRSDSVFFSSEFPSNLDLAGLNLLGGKSRA